MTVHISFLPVLSRLCLGVSLCDLVGMPAVVQVSLIQPTLPREMRNVTGEISDILRDL